MNLSKIAGWVLLFGGLAIIIYALYSSFNIFTGAKPAPEIFKITEKEIAPAPVTQKAKTQDLETQLQSQIEKLMGEQLKGILPSDFLPKLFNLIVWGMLAGILVFGGFNIASLGIKLIK